MLKKMNYPLENQITGPILKPTVYADNNDTLGNSLLTVNEIYEGNYTYRFYLSTLIHLVEAGSPTRGDFIIDGITFALTSMSIYRLNFPGSYEGAYDYIQLTATTASSTKLKAAIEASTLRQTMGIRINTEDGESRDWYPEIAGSGSLFQWRGPIYADSGDENDMMVLRLQDAGVIAEIVTDIAVWGSGVDNDTHSSDSITLSLLT